MTGRSRVGLLLAGMALFASVDTRAEDAAPARRDRVVARVGTTGTITVGELEDRLAGLPLFQRTAFGATADAVRHKFLSDVLLPETLFALGGEAQKLEAQVRPAYEIERARSSATIRALRDRLGPASAIPFADVQKYYDENRARYDTPERYQIWRILCATRAEAVDVLEQSKRDPSFKAFGDLAREHSLDKATNLRSGNLGFVTSDGTSNEPGLRVDPAVVQAAQRVRDGELVPAPVAEGPYFSVVWRRGTIPANKRSVEEVAAAIRDAIWKGRLKEETDYLLASLRATRLRDFNPSLLDSLSLPFDAGAGGMGPRGPAVASSASSPK